MMEIRLVFSGGCAPPFSTIKSKSRFAVSSQMIQKGLARKLLRISCRIFSFRQAINFFRFTGSVLVSPKRNFEALANDLNKAVRNSRCRQSHEVGLYMKPKTDVHISEPLLLNSLFTQKLAFKLRFNGGKGYGTNNTLKPAFQEILFHTAIS